VNDAFLIAGLVVRSINLFDWIVIAAAIGAAFWFPKRRWHKAGFAAVALAALSYLPAEKGLKEYEALQYRKAAWAHFKKRCDENAGEKIYKIAQNVDGIFLMKPRPKATQDQLRDQYWMGDPYGYRHSMPWQFPFLWDLNERGGSTTTRTERRGFDFVEVPQPDSANQFKEPVLHFTLNRESRKLVEKSVSTRQSVYGIVWEDTSTREDRSYWVAGSKFQVVDLRSNEVMAERIGYLIESGFGSTGYGGGRDAWDAATVTGSACPPFERHALVDRLFVEKVLKPSTRYSPAN